MDGVTVVQDSTITQLLDDKTTGTIRGQEEVQGFRVQVYSSNDQSVAKQQAMDLEHQLKEVLDEPVYVIYTPPFWKVRIGDFRTQDEAKEYKDTLVVHIPEMAPETYIVRDKIQVKK